MSVISKIETGCYRVPLPVVLSDSTHGDLTHFELILVQIEDAEGSKASAIPIPSEAEVKQQESW